MLLSYDFRQWLGSNLKNDFVGLLLLVKVLSWLLSITKSALSPFLINVPSSWTLLLILLLLSVADKTFSAIFRDFNVSYRQTFWRIQPFLMWIGRACCSGKEPNLLLPLQVISAFYKIVSIMKCVALGTKITKNS